MAKTTKELLELQQQKMLTYRKRNNKEGGKYYRSLKKKVADLKEQIKEDEAYLKRKRLNSYKRFLGI